MPRVVVVVVSWNTRELLDACLATLRGVPHAQVWVVDNGSSDGSAEMVRERHPWAQLVQADENLGYGRAINLVAARTDSEWIAVANADVALQAGALERLLAAGERRPQVGAVAPRLLLPGGGTQHSVWAFPTVGAALVQSLGVRLAGRRLSERLVLRGAWDPERPRLVPWAIGAFLLVRRAAFTQVGGFDEAQWLGAEDLDLGWRLHQTGWRTYYEPAARVRHEESAATAQVWGEALPVQWQRAAYAWMVWRLGRPRTAAVGLVNFFGSATRLLGLAARRARGEPVPLRPDLRWTAVHVYALAPRRVLARHR